MLELWNSVKDNLTFLLVCALTAGGLFFLAKLFEHVFMPEERRAAGARYAAYVGMFSAVAGVLMLLEIPLFFAPSFYKMDLSELPVMLCAFYLGPVAGVTTELLKVVIKILLRGTSTAFVGDFANFLVGSMYVLPAAVIYHANKTKRTAVIGMAAGMACMTVVGSIFNALYLIPKFAQLFGMPVSVIVSMGNAVNKNIVSVSTLVLFAVVPFNILKSTIDSILTYLLYKRLKGVIFKE